LTLPKPDQIDHPSPFQSRVKIRSVGLLPASREAEVFASDERGTQWCRFHLRRTSRVVRSFLEGQGHTPWSEGVVESKQGFGLFDLSATQIGTDLVDEDSTAVLTEVTLRDVR